MKMVTWIKQHEIWSPWTIGVFLFLLLFNGVPSILDQESIWGMIGATFGAIIGAYLIVYVLKKAYLYFAGTESTNS